MNHKKITVAGIMVVTIFSFSMLKPMWQRGKGKPTEKFLQKVTLKDDATEKTVTIDFDNLDNIMIFNDANHLKNLCQLLGNIKNHHSLSATQKTVKIFQKNLDWGVPIIVGGIFGWAMKGAIKEHLSLKKLIAPTIAVTIGTTHLLTKNYFSNIIKKRKQEAHSRLSEKQNQLFKSLLEIAAYDFSRYTKNQHNKIFKSITLFWALENQARESKKFAAWLKTMLSNKIEPANLWLERLGPKSGPRIPAKKILEKNFMPGAREKVKMLMEAPPTPEQNLLDLL